MMSTTRKLALAGGIFYLLTFAFSLPTLGMKAPLDDPAFVLGAGDDTGVVWAALFDFLTGVTGIGTAVALYPVARRVSRTRSLGFVTSRVVEAGILDGDYVVVQRQQTARDGEIVVALAGEDEAADEATVKRFFREKGRVRLQPENSAMEPLYPEHVSVLGKVVAGDADAGFVYVTDAAAAGDDVQAIELPAQPLVEYPIAVVTESENAEAAEAFVELVLSEEGRRALQEAGFGVP